MRYTLGLLLAIVVMGLFGLGESEAACRAEGEYRVTGPTSGGLATLTETTVAAPFSSRTAVLNIVGKQTCPVCLIGGNTLTGEYQTGPGWDGGCFLDLKVLDPVTGRTASVSGTLMFGGAVIMFESYEVLRPTLDLNLTLGIRSDFVLRP